MLGLANPLSGVWPLAAVALVPWLLATARCASLTTAVGGSLLVGALAGAATAPWIPEALSQLGAKPLSAWLGLLVTVLWARGLPFALLGALVYALRRQPDWVRVAGVAAGLFALDGIALSWAMGVPWGLLGHSQHAAPGVAQLALVGGVALLSALLAAINQAAAIVFESRGRRGAVALLAGLVAAWLTSAALGLPLAKQVRGALLPPEGPTFDLLAVQPDIPRGERWAEGLQPLHLTRIGRYTERVLSERVLSERVLSERVLSERVLSERVLSERNDPPDAILWPENLLTSPVDTTPGLAEALQSWVDRLGVPVILGAARSARSGDPRRYRGSVLWIAPESGVVAAIDKTRAVPGVESGAVFSSLAAPAFGRAGDWEKVEEAPRQGPLQGAFSVAPVLCYEALFPGLVAERRAPGSVAILNLADDSWVGGEMATRQLLAYAAFRAIEQRLTLVRVAHGGLSAVVDPFGETTVALPLDEYASVRVAVQAQPPPTLAEKTLLIALPLLSGVGVWFVVSRRPRRGARVGRRGGDPGKTHRRKRP